MPKIKNIIIFIVIGAILILSYVFFVKPSSTPNNLISATPVSPSSGMMANAGDSSVARDFLTLLLNVKNIKLDDTIFSDNAFMSLRDSSIILTADGTEGRPNPFAPLGSDNITPVTPIIPPSTIIIPTAPVTPTTPVAPTAKPKKP